MSEKCPNALLAFQIYHLEFLMGTLQCDSIKCEFQLSTNSSSSCFSEHEVMMAVGQKDEDSIIGKGGYKHGDN